MQKTLSNRHLTNPIIASVIYQLTLKFINSTDFDQQIFQKLYFQRILCLFVCFSSRAYFSLMW